MTPRRWIAWKLVQLAYRLHMPLYDQDIIIESPSGEVYTINIIGDIYGSGIISTQGIRWQPQPGGIETADVEGWRFTWADEPCDTSD